MSLGSHCIKGTPYEDDVLPPTVLSSETGAYRGLFAAVSYGDPMATSSKESGAQPPASHLPSAEGPLEQGNSWGAPLSPPAAGGPVSSDGKEAASTRRDQSRGEHDGRQAKYEEGSTVPLYTWPWAPCALAASGFLLLSVRCRYIMSRRRVEVEWPSTVRTAATPAATDVARPG